MNGTKKTAQAPQALAVSSIAARTHFVLQIDKIPQMSKKVKSDVKPVTECGSAFPPAAQLGENSHMDYSAANREPCDLQEVQGTPSVNKHQRKGIVSRSPARCKRRRGFRLGR